LPVGEIRVLVYPLAQRVGDLLSGVLIAHVVEAVSFEFIVVPGGVV
jgi:hypothetical protein